MNAKQNTAMDERQNKLVAGTGEKQRGRDWLHQTVTAEASYQEEPAEDDSLNAANKSESVHSDRQTKIKSAEKSQKEDLNEDIKSFDTQEFEDLEKEFAEETLREEKDQIDTKDHIKPPVVENPNDQSQIASNIKVVSEVQTIKSEVFFIQL